jgi:replication factor C subunit 2/4
MLARLRLVCEGEKVEVSDETLLEVLRVSNGDMRKAITFLQSASQLYGGTIKPENVVEISGFVPDKSIENIILRCKEGTFQPVRASIQSVLLGGYSVGIILERLMEAVIADETLSSTAKANVCERISAAEKKLFDGADEELQLVDVAECLLRQIKGVSVSADREKFYI